MKILDWFSEILMMLPQIAFIILTLVEFYLYFEFGG